jgi:hypothetical protein
MRKPFVGHSLFYILVADFKMEGRNRYSIAHRASPEEMASHMRLSYR